MISTHDLHAAKRMNFAAQLADRYGCSQKILGRHGAEAANEFRADEVELIFQVAAAIRKFVRQRISIPGRPAFKHVQDVNVLPLQPAGFNDLREQLSAATNERDASLVFIGARSLAQETQPR